MAEKHSGFELLGNIDVVDGIAIGQAAGPLITFDDTNNFLEITGCSVGIGTAAPSWKFSIGSTDASNQIGIFHDNTDAYFTTDDGSFIFLTDEGVNTDTHLYIKGKGTGKGYVRLYDQDDNEYLELIASIGYGHIRTGGVSPGNLEFQNTQPLNIKCWASIPSGNPSFYAYGYKTAVGVKYIKMHVSSGGHGYLTAEDRLYLVGSTIRNQADTYIAGELYVAGAISSGTSTFTTAGPTDNVPVGNINTLFVDTTANNVTIGGLAGGVNGQRVSIVKCCLSGVLTIENVEGGGSQDIYLHKGADEALSLEVGGWEFICDGTSWWDVSHAKHV